MNNVQKMLHRKYKIRMLYEKMFSTYIMKIENWQFFLDIFQSISFKYFRRLLLVSSLTFNCTSILEIYPSYFFPVKCHVWMFKEEYRQKIYVVTPHLTHAQTHKKYDYFLFPRLLFSILDFKNYGFYLHKRKKLF